MSELRPEVIAALARAVVAKVERETPRMTTKTADVVASAAGTAANAFPILQVHIDGDPAGHSVPVVSLCGDRGIGARVTILFTPPNGALAIGGVESIPVMGLTNDCSDGGDPQ